MASAELFWLLSERTPLVWWQVEDLVGIRATTFGGSSAGESALLRLSFSALQGLTLAAVLEDRSPRFLRADVIARLKSLRDPEAVAGPLRGTTYFQQAIEEWRQVLASPFSPVPLLEDALSRPWEELPATAEGILDFYRQTRDRLERGE